MSVAELVHSLAYKLQVGKTGGRACSHGVSVGLRTLELDVEVGDARFQLFYSHFAVYPRFFGLAV